MEQDLTQYVNTLFSNMESFAQNEGLIGKPVTQGDKTFLPVVSVMIGFGGGDSQSKMNKSSAGSNSFGMGNIMGGGALGLGAKLCTDAVLILDNNNVSVAPIGAQSSISQVIDKIPQIIGNMNQQGGQQGSQQGNQQGMQQGSQQGGQ
jgi:uncharacterized spore protein YtfJ